MENSSAEDTFNKLKYTHLVKFIDGEEIHVVLKRELDAGILGQGMQMGGCLEIEGYYISLDTIKYIRKL